MTCSNLTKLFFFVFFVVFGSAIVNEFTGYDEFVGEPYISYYSYCAEYQYGPKGVTTCLRMGSAHEKRVNTIHHGMLWSNSAYKVVN